MDGRIRHGIGAPRREHSQVVGTEGKRFIIKLWELWDADVLGRLALELLVLSTNYSTVVTVP